LLWRRLNVKKYSPILAFILAGLIGPILCRLPALGAPAVTEATGDAVLGKAFRDRISNIQVEGRGEVTRILPDDQDGSRHQRFLLRLRSGQTLLIAHNVDLAPRVAPLMERDLVSFYGEYEWNEKGGVIHWTHRDPTARHEAGWLKHKGRLYQ
jgi:hypothetical protein